MQINKDNNKMQDDKIKEILSLSKVKAGENLKYRIMQQIETESVLSAKKLKSKNVIPLIGNTFLIFGVMYALIVFTIIAIFLTGGVDAIKSLTFFVPVVMITIVCSMFWIISLYDDKRRFKQENQSR